MFQKYLWWRRWGNLTIKLFPHVGSFASMLGLVIVLSPTRDDISVSAIILSVIAIVLFIVSVYFEFQESRKLKTYLKSDSEGIKDYMHDWIQHGGRTAVWTRDMSWAKNYETRTLLKTKARNGELIVCLPKSDEFTAELREAGADIRDYGSFSNLDTPHSRFTITYFGRDGAQVAVGRADGDIHTIEEFSSGEDPIFFLARDLVELSKGVNRQEC